MSDLSSVERLRAWIDGRPRPLGETIAWPRLRAARAMVVAMVRMAGETTPWAIAWGHPGCTPTVVSVPDPRQQDAVRAMVVPFAEALLAHFGHPAFGDAVDLTDTQLVMPGSSHVEMLHLLEYRYARAQKISGAERETVNAFGRLVGWLFRESQRPHQRTVMDVTRALREAWAIPADDLRQQHLGLVLAWLADGTRAQREALAEAAEQRTVSTTLDPALDRRIEPLVDRWNHSVSKGSDAAAAVEIRAAVEGEVLRRWTLAAEGWQRIQRDLRPTHTGLAALATIAREEYARQWRATEEKLGRGEAAFVPSAETDAHAAAAASRFYAIQRVQERR